jgi:sugar transferase (PEP-CTERM/EpsH1 system associated)
MRILFLTPRFPLPTTKGDKLRSWQIIRKLASEHEVVLISFIDEETEQEFIPEVKKYCAVETVPFRKVPQFIGTLSASFGTEPLQVKLFDSQEIKSLVDKHLPETDVIHLSTLRMASNIPDDFDGKLVVDFIDALSMNFKRTEEKLKSPMKIVYRTEHHRLTEYESRLLDRADAAFTVSPVDSRIIGGKASVIPNSVNTDEFSPPEYGYNRKDIIFTGNMNYQPNVEGAKFMANEIMPIVNRAVPDLKLRLVGKDPCPAVRALANENVEITGFVEKISDEIRNSAVSVAPMVSGSGLQNKVLEAMGCATPVVSTSMANSGIGACHGSEILLSDEPVEFASHIVSLIKDRSKADTVGNGGRKFVEEKFSWEGTRLKLLEIYRSLEK